MPGRKAIEAPADTMTTASIESTTASTEATTAPTDNRIASTLRALLAARAPDATLCPSEVARALEPDSDTWRALMPRVRAVAFDLARRGEAVITQRGRVVDPDSLPPGPLRIAHPPRSPGAR